MKCIRIALLTIALLITTDKIYAYDEASIATTNSTPLMYIGSGIIIGAACTWIAHEYYRSHQMDNAHTASLQKIIPVLPSLPNTQCLHTAVGFPKELISDLKRITDTFKSMHDVQQTVSDTGVNILIIGDYGSGKSYLAQTIAAQMACPYFSLYGSDILYTDDGASALEEVFSRAKQEDIAIVYIDRIDTILSQNHAIADHLLGQLERNQNLMVIMTCLSLDLSSPLAHRCQTIIDLSFPLQSERVEIINSYIPPSMQQDPESVKLAASYMQQWSRGDIAKLAKTVRFNTFNPKQRYNLEGSLFQVNETMSIDDPPETKITYNDIVQASNIMSKVWESQYWQSCGEEPGQESSDKTLPRQSVVELPPPVVDEK